MDGQTYYEDRLSEDTYARQPDGRRLVVAPRGQLERYRRLWPAQSYRVVESAAMATNDEAPL